MDFAPLRAALAEALETLADDQREALKLRAIDGLPYPDVAARLQCAETARAPAGESRAPASRRWFSRNAD